MVEQDPVACVDTVRLAVVDGDPVRVEFRARAPRVKRRLLRLRDFLHEAVQLRRRRLVNPRLLREPEQSNAGNLVYALTTVVSGVIDALRESCSVNAQKIWIVPNIRKLMLISSGALTKAPPRTADDLSAKIRCTSWDGVRQGRVDGA